MVGSFIVFPKIYREPVTNCDDRPLENEINAERFKQNNKNKWSLGGDLNTQQIGFSVSE